MKTIFKILYVYLICLITLDALASENNFVIKPKMQLDEIANQSLNYALNTQIQSDTSYYVKGEFPTLIQSTLVPVLAGVGQLIGQDQEASAFTTASVINVLAQTYLDNKHLIAHYSSLARIPEIIKDGVHSFERYSAGSSFNFYPPYNDDGKIVRRPIAMKLNSLWFGFTNIPNDADTTSVTLSALAFNSKINKVPYSVKPQTINGFSQYRDINRSPMFYNRQQNRINTGAFLTWLYDENDPKMPRNYFADAKKGERIPFNVNDVDCIVNANIIKMSALSQNQDMLGYKESCRMINSMIQKDEHAYCGIYYPNTYNLSFAMASAEKAGDRCLTQDSRLSIVNKILSLQDGYTGAWSNDKNIWQDQTLSTAFAMYSLLQFANPRDYKVYVALLYGTHFLLSQIQYKKDSIHWPSDNFFTATALARSLVMWRSEAYTNAIISHILFKMHNLFPEFNSENYLKLKFDH